MRRPPEIFYAKTSNDAHFSQRTLPVKNTIKCSKSQHIFYKAFAINLSAVFVIVDLTRNPLRNQVKLQVNSATIGGHQTADCFCIIYVYSSLTLKITPTAVISAPRGRRIIQRLDVPVCGRGGLCTGGLSSSGSSSS